MKKILIALCVTVLFLSGCTFNHKDNSIDSLTLQGEDDSVNAQGEDSATTADKDEVIDNSPKYTLAENPILNFDELKSVEFYISTYVSDDPGYDACLSGYLDVSNNKIYYSKGTDIIYFVEKEEDSEDEEPRGYERHDISDEEIEELISLMKKDYFVYDASNGWIVTFQYEDGSTEKFSLPELNYDKEQLNMAVKFFEKMQDTYGIGVDFLADFTQYVE